VFDEELLFDWSLLMM